MESRTYTARWILPVAGPPLERGTVTVRGELIESVEPIGVRIPDEDFGDAVVIPGLVNAHTHLDLTGAGELARRDATEVFPEWLKRVIDFRGSRTPEQVDSDIQRGLKESLKHGVTLLGDIASGGASWKHLAQAPLRSVVFWELIGATLERFELALHTSMLGMAAQPNTPTCRWGRSPHAPYTVHKRGYELAAGLPGIQAVHLAESSAEMKLLRMRSGPFLPFLQELGVWEPGGLIHDPAEFLRTHPDLQSLFVHGNYLEADTPLSANQSLVVCPRTHAAFGHPPHPFREFLARGVNVCVGTDSPASNPSLDVLAELGELHRRYPDVPSHTLLRMGTINGAKALGFAEVCGTLEAGKSADFVALTGAKPDAPFTATERRTMFRGEWR